MITMREKKTKKTSVGQSKLLNSNILSLLWANETSALLGNGSVLAVSVTHLPVLAALAKKMASNIHAKHPSVYFICLKWRTLHQMLRLFLMLTSFPFLSQHLGSGPHYLAFRYSDNLLFLLWLPSHFFLSGPPPHHPLRGLVLGCLCLKALYRLQLLPRLHTLASPWRLIGSMPNYSQKPNGHPNRSVSYFLNMQRALISTTFIQMNLFLPLSVCKIRIPAPHTNAQKEG